MMKINEWNDHVCCHFGQIAQFTFIDDTKIIVILIIALIAETGEKMTTKEAKTTIDTNTHASVNFFRWTQFLWSCLSYRNNNSLNKNNYYVYGYRHIHIALLSDLINCVTFNRLRWEKNVKYKLQLTMLNAHNNKK